MKKEILYYFLTKTLILQIILMVISCELFSPSELVIKNNGVFKYQIIGYDVFNNEKYNTEIKEKSEKSFLLYSGKYKFIFINNDYKIKSEKQFEISPNQILFHELFNEK